MPPEPKDDISSLEEARRRLYSPQAGDSASRDLLSGASQGEVPHTWGDELPEHPEVIGKKRVRAAGIFFGAAFAFFVVALAVAAALFYFGGNSVSVDKIDIEIQGPTTIAGGDTVPLSIAITNKNPIAIDNATFEITFPEGTRNADNVLASFQRYTENFGSIPSGTTLVRSVKAVMFGGEGQTLTLPVSLTYGAASSNSVFVKKSSYPIKISSTPLSVSVETLAETVSGKSLTLTLTVRSNATVPLQNVALKAALPFGFSATSSSVPLEDGVFLLGTLTPGATKTVTLTGTLLGQDKEERVFRFTVGTTKSASDSTLAVSYMTQDASVAISAPFLQTTLAINGNTSPSVVVTPGALHTGTLSYTNTLPSAITNAIVTISISGSAVDYANVRTNNGFYNSSDRTIVFSKDTDPSLAALAPGASGLGTFSFATLPTAAGNIQFTVSVSGTREGQSNVPESVSASISKTVKVATVVSLSVSSLRGGGSITNSGPVPPVPGLPTTYTIAWLVQSKGSAVADATVTATLPSYVTYTESTSGAGSFSYDSASRTVTWKAGDLAAGGTAQGLFQVSLTPSTSQKGTAPELTSEVSFSGYDRFAGVQVSASASPATSQTADGGSGTVQ